MKVLGRPNENLDEDEENDNSWNSYKSWSPWEKIELTIPSKFVSPIKYNGKLFIFWVTITTLSKSKIESGATVNEGYSHKIDLNYSYLLSSGKWLQPQKIADFFTGAGDPDDNTLYGFNNSLLKNRIYPFISGNNEILVDYLRSNGTNSYLGTFSLNTYHNVLTENFPETRSYFNDNFCKWRVLDNAVYIGKELDTPINYFIGESNDVYAHYNANSEAQITLQSDATIIAIPLDPVYNNLNQEIRIVQNNDNDYLLKLDEVNYLIRWTLNGEKSPEWSFGAEWKIYKKYVESNREMIRLNTTSIKELVNVFSTSDLDGFLQITSQQTPEIPAKLKFIDHEKLLPPHSELFSLDWMGSHGLYYQELFFHIPYTIANHLNKEGKYKEADYWYRKIFDPSAKYEPNVESDRYWQFLQFRNQTVESLLDMLTNRAAIDEFENNPFNPHAIARIRISAYQKNIVMKYIDNILDWADSLFKMDTWEANTEALMLYMLAKDILGERPEPVGKCETAVEEKNCGCENPVTYDAIKNYEGGLEVSEFIHYVDNWIPISSIETEVVIGDSTGLGSISSRESALRTGLELETSEKTSLNQFSEVYSTELLPMLGTQTMIKKGSNLVFCIPHNEKIFEYWDRVDDRLFKLRNCMNIDGVKRSLALFQPPIDPALLVAAFAAGLSIDDVLNSLYGDLPAYRFSYLIDRAKGYAGTVQGMANSLLSALEKKDNEQLTLLRSTQEQNLLKMTKEVKKKAIDDAKANLQATMEGMTNTMNKQLHYFGLIENGLNTWEVLNQTSVHNSTLYANYENIQNLTAAIVSLIPQIGAPTSMNFGGNQLQNAARAAGKALSAVAAIHRSIGNSASLEGSNQRRKEDWEFQLKLSEQELKQVQQQIISAQIRLAMAEKDLEIHEKQMDQVKEIHEFYKSKFTNLDLYGFLSKSLNTYQRMAYNMAVDMAQQAEAAYKFETGEDTYTGVSGGTFWDSTKAGLLSGEQLTLELQNMEVKYMEWNHRQMEIRQSFSMLMMDPAALVELRKDGACTFKIPEWAFDLQYPGHYRRRIVSVQLTMPCIVGPYQNVAATLTFINGRLNKLGKEGGTVLFPFGGSKMVATSSAQNDGGQFDLNFRDERYLPFEGAGAVESEWRLDLPTALKSFDYNAIADVIFHISYRSKYDGVFKGVVEGNLKASINDGGLKRLVSLRQEFPELWYELERNGSTNFDLSKVKFPYFANVRDEVYIIKYFKIGDDGEISWPLLVESTDLYPLDNSLHTYDNDVLILIEYKLV
ncbi:MAG: hypothetical protein IPN15_22265 [Saprospiraceae bacterium]|nr:hypothetical protein [Candidatus Vicinibacter affinis]